MTSRNERMINYISDNIDAIIEDKLSVKMIADEFNVTKQLVCYRIDKIDDTIFKRRDDLINQRLEIIARQIKEGIPLEVIFEQPFAQNFLTDKGKQNIHRAKDLILNRIRSRNIVSDEDEINKYTFVQAKLMNYINILQIETALSDGTDINRAEISRLYNASYVKVLKIDKDLQSSPEYRALQNLPKRAYDVLKRNISIAIEYQKGTNVSKIHDMYSSIDKNDLTLIIESYTPYIV